MKSGILKEINGEQWGVWVVAVPLQHTYRFREFLELWDVKYEAFTILKAVDLFYRFLDRENTSRQLHHLVLTLCLFTLGAFSGKQECSKTFLRGGPRCYWDLGR
jgi:hypothetical protein